MADTPASRRVGAAPGAAAVYAVGATAATTTAAPPEAAVAIDTGWAFARYETLRANLPRARFACTSRHVYDLGAVLEHYDAFILDAFGVLNIGERPIPGAADRIARLRAAGKRLVVLTNRASASRQVALAKYARLGLDFAAAEVVASRDLAAAALTRFPRAHVWAGITSPGADLDDLAPARVLPLTADTGLLETADGFIFLGSEGWTTTRQEALAGALARRRRPLIVANPDIVAPREGGFSLEPGHFAADLTGQLEWHGKPHVPAFEAAIARLQVQHSGPPIPRERIAMVGDTLHTDVLGGAAAGLGTVLIAGHGLFRGHDPAPFIAASGIVPDVIAQTI